MNIQVATSEIPVTAALRTTSRLASTNFAQRAAPARFRGARGGAAASSSRGN